MDIRAEEGRRYLSLAELHEALRSARSLEAFHVVAGNALKSPVAEVAEHGLVECRETGWCQWRTKMAANYRRRWLANTSAT
jgi:hypothetical protein